MTSKEPLITVAFITALTAAVIALLVAFGVPLTPDQRTAILGLAAVLAPVTVALIARRLVTPNGSVVEQVESRDGEDTVVAGPANAIPTGAAIRPLSAHPTYEAPPA